METRANYALIGAFTLAVIAAGFLFVFWFSGGGKSADRKTYQIVFTGSVSGLNRGSSVLFNGLRVGEVTQIDLMDQDPSRVAALIQISARTPVKEDTRARLEFQGLTGVASVALTGGNATSAELEPREKGGNAVIYADRSDFQNLLESVQRLAAKSDTILDRIDKVLLDNAEPLNQTMRNAQAFSKALADNADGVNKALAAVAEVGQKIGPLTTKLGDLADDAGRIVRAVDPDRIRGILANVDRVTGTLAANEANVNQFIADAAGLAKRLNDTAGKLDNVLDLAGGTLTALDGKKIAEIVDNLDGMSKTLQANRGNVDRILKDGGDLVANLKVSSTKVDQVLDSVQKFLGGPDAKGALADVGEAARSIRKLADNLDGRTKEITAGITRFTGPTAREYEALASEGRRAINELNRAIRSIERNPQQFIFGGKPAIPEYSGSR